MARKTSSQQPRPVTAERASRLYQLISLLGKKAHSRDDIVLSLGLDVRTFYRDLETLRNWGININLDDEGRYTLAISKTDAIGLLPFPDPQLTVGEAEQLAKGRTKAHKKMKEALNVIKTKPEPKKTEDKPKSKSKKKTERQPKSKTPPKPKSEKSTKPKSKSKPRSSTTKSKKKES
ncbi:MAG: hypothetical protein ACFCD0_06045 [Gemmataceae bacterium]